MSVEKKTANTIREKAEEIVIAGETIMFAPPSVGTIIEVSGDIGELPTFEATTEEECIDMMIANADQMKVIGRIIALLIIGVDRAEKGFFYSLMHPYTGKRGVSKLQKMLLNNITPLELFATYKRLIERAQIYFFFQTFTSLNEIAMLKPTKTTEMIASGQSSEE